jgi:hypothetical protein
MNNFASLVGLMSSIKVNATILMLNVSKFWHDFISHQDVYFWLFSMILISFSISKVLEYQQNFS